MLFSKRLTTSPKAGTALLGRNAPIKTAARHYVNDRTLKGEIPEGYEVALFGMGCFWGVERLFWKLDGVYLTMVGYAGGETPNPTYEEVCTGYTNHNEVVKIIFDPKKITFEALLKVFWEGHDPTQGMRQGNDRGTQYRSGIYTFSKAQEDAALRSKELYAAHLSSSGYGAITTEIKTAPEFFFAEDYHQQYLAKNPNGYCGIGGTGVTCPISLTANAPVCWSAFTSLKGRDAAERLGEALELLENTPTGVGVFEVEDGSEIWEVSAFFATKPDDVALDLLALAHGAKAFVISALPEKDWVSQVQRELKPVEAGRFFLYGAHDAENVPSDRTSLLIEASMAFGTGHHATTKGCLLELDALIDEGFAPNRVLDVGCGTAVLAMAAAKSFPSKIWASDIDATAIDVAKENVKLNGLEAQIQLVQASGLESPILLENSPYDLIFCNILAGPLMDLAEVLTERLEKQGRIILSGILEDQEEKLLRTYIDLGCFPAHKSSSGEWVAVTLTKERIL